MGAIVALAAEFGMEKKVDQACHPTKGNHLRIIDSFADAACSHPDNKSAVKKKILEYFTQVTNEKDNNGNGFGYHYNRFSQAFSSPSIDWKNHRDQAYLALAALVKEVEVMVGEVQSALESKSDGPSKAKKEKAAKFLEVAKNTLNEMKAAGGISEAVCEQAQNIQAKFFPQLIEEQQILPVVTAPTPQVQVNTAPPIAEIAPIAQNVEAEAVVGNAATNITVSQQQSGDWQAGIDHLQEKLQTEKTRIDSLGQKIKKFWDTRNEFNSEIPFPENIEQFLKDGFKLVCMSVQRLKKPTTANTVKFNDLENFDTRLNEIASVVADLMTDKLSKIPKEDQQAFQENQERRFLKSLDILVALTDEVCKHALAVKVQAPQLNP